MSVAARPDELPGSAVQSPAEFTWQETEAGRKLFTGDWQFIAAAGAIARLPPMHGIEIAVAGRSNIRQESSLINALTSRKARPHLAHARPHPAAGVLRAGPISCWSTCRATVAAAAKTKIAAWARSSTRTSPAAPTWRASMC